jgi:hypothetical protein
MMVHETDPEAEYTGSLNNEEKNIPVLYMIYMRQIVFKSSQFDFSQCFSTNKFVLLILFYLIQYYFIRWGY